MEYLLEMQPELKAVRAAARELAGVFAGRAAAHDRDRSAPLENYADLRERGYFGFVAPKEYGGQGHGFLGWCVAGEELAQGCGSTALSFNMHVMDVGMTFREPKVTEAKRRWVADLVIGQGKLLCGSLSEPGSASYLAPTFIPTLTAQPVAGGWRLYGKKAFATMWEASDYAYMFARPEGDPNPQHCLALVVPTHGEGITVEDVWHTMGMRATRSQNVVLDGAFVPAEHLLYDTDTVIDSFLGQHGAWSYGAYTSVYLGVGVGILNYARKHLATRVAKGCTQPMGYHPDIRRRVADMAAELDAARLVLWQAAWDYDTHGPTPENGLQLLKAKYLVGQAVTHAVQNAVVACGVRSLFEEAGLERLVRDAATAPIQPPNADMCLGMIGLMEMGLDPTEALPPLK
jgi:alkylation response protein AidB-like acyl-CoA dehydrogenase